jgi:hypothetical protein
LQGGVNIRYCLVKCEHLGTASILTEVKLINEQQAELSSHEIEEMKVDRLAALDVGQNQKPIDSHP